MSSKDTEGHVEVILGFVLGIVSVVLGSLFIAWSCNLAFPAPPSGFACRISGSNLLVPVGIVLVPLGAVVVGASIVVLRGRKKV